MLRYFSFIYYIITVLIALGVLNSFIYFDLATWTAVILTIVLLIGVRALVIRYSKKE